MFSSGPIPYNFAYAFHIAPMPSACSAHIIFLDFVTIRTFGEGHRLWSSYYGVFCSLLLIYSSDILFSMLFSNTVSVLPLMWERPMPTKGRITFLYIYNHFYVGFKKNINWFCIRFITVVQFCWGKKQFQMTGFDSQCKRVVFYFLTCHCLWILEQF
jgi:hypothetical protein